MTIQTTISLILAPVVMISCTTLFLNGLIERYESLGARMRSMHIEHIDLLRILRNSTKHLGENDKESHDLHVERLKEIELQLPRLLHRHHMLHKAILASEGSIFILVLSMFVISIDVISKIQWMQLIALLTLLFGAGLFLLSVLINAFEFRASPREVTFEVQHGLKISR